MATDGATQEAVQDEYGLRLTRLFAAPPGRLFAAWTRPIQAMRWWGPSGRVVTVCSMNPRPGRSWRACLRAPGGTDHEMHGAFRAIAAPGRLSFISSCIKDSETTAESLVAIGLDTVEGGTRMTFRPSPFETLQIRESHRDGWTQSFDRLEDHGRHG